MRDEILETYPADSSNPNYEAPSNDGFANAGPAPPTTSGPFGRSIGQWYSYWDNLEGGYKICWNSSLVNRPPALPGEKERTSMKGEY